MPEMVALIAYENGRTNTESSRQVVQTKMSEQSAKDKTRFDKGKAKIKRFEIGEYVLISENPRLGSKLGQTFI